MTPTWTPPDAEVVTLAEAAVRLGISPDAARKRLERGTLRGEKRGNRWRVYLEPDASSDIAYDGTPDAERTPADAFTERLPDSDIVAVLRDEVNFLRNELAERTEEIRRRDHIIAGLVERVRELPATIESASQDANNVPLSDDHPRMAPRQSLSQPPVSDTLALGWRKWWRRLTGSG